MNRKSLFSGALVLLVMVLPCGAFGAGVEHRSCRATLTTADAKLLAAAIPNARAFHDNLHATLKTDIASVRASGVVDVRVTAKQPGAGAMEVGTYTVNLHSGRVIDDDQEPADDAQTLALRDRLMQQRCH